MATLEEQLNAAKQLLGEKEMELQAAKAGMAAGQQLLLAVCAYEMLRPLGEAVATKPRPLASGAGRLRASTMAIVTKG